MSTLYCGFSHFPSNYIKSQYDLFMDSINIIFYLFPFICALYNLSVIVTLHLPESVSLSASVSQCLYLCFFLSHYFPCVYLCQCVCIFLCIPFSFPWILSFPCSYPWMLSRQYSPHNLVSPSRSSDQIKYDNSFAAPQIRS